MNICTNVDINNAFIQSVKFDRKNIMKYLVEKGADISF